MLLVDGGADAGRTATILRQCYRSVNVTARQQTALQYLQRATPDLVVANVSLEDGSAVEICRQAQLKTEPPAILITPDTVEEAPDVLAAGCDGVLVKPFTPSLLVNRVSRLLRARSQQLRLRAAWTRGKAAHLVERVDLLKIGTNRVWPSTHCPYCSHPGVTSFDYASQRRAWYACLACRKCGWQNGWRPSGIFLPHQIRRRPRRYTVVGI